MAQIVDGKPVTKGKQAVLDAAFTYCDKHWKHFDHLNQAFQQHGSITDWPESVSNTNKQLLDNVKKAESELHRAARRLRRNIRA